MEVYVEYALIDNLVLDYLLIIATHQLTKTKRIYFLIWFGALVGTIVALIVPIFNLSKGVSFIIKIILALLICLICAKHNSVFNYLKFVNVFVLLTFMVGGVVIGALGLIGIDYSISSIKKGGILPIGINFLVAFLAYKLVKYFSQSLINKKSKNFTCKILISVNGKRKVFTAFVDTGNFLVEASSGLSVIVCDEKIKEIFSLDKGKKFMPINTASGLGMIELFPLDYVTVITADGEKFKDAILGVTKQRLWVDSDCLISPELL